MTIIVFILIISFLIFIHELGHLLAAKWANVKVENFSVGFGPKLFKFNIGETEYSLSALPLGGYVKMQGENPTEINDDSIIDPSRSFSNIPIYKKQIIMDAYYSKKHAIFFNFGMSCISNVLILCIV